MRAERGTSQAQGRGRAYPRRREETSLVEKKQWGNEYCLEEWSLWDRRAPQPPEASSPQTACTLPYLPQQDQGLCPSRPLAPLSCSPC